MVESRAASSILACAGHCQTRQEEDGDCNSFSYEETRASQCELGSLSYLEDPAPGEAWVRLMVVESVLESLRMYCRGGESCCGVSGTRLCGEGEGDCDLDSQCAGVLECGTDNCPYTGGLWDDTDDCCQKRCSSDRPCGQGWGPCSDNSHCQGSQNGYNICSDKCLGTQTVNTNFIKVKNNFPISQSLKKNSTKAQF